MAFLCLSSSLLVSALRPFPTWVDISQQCLMYIWPLMLSLRVPEPEAQLKLTTPEALPPALIPTLPHTHPPSNPPFVSCTSFCLTHYFSSLTYFFSTCLLLPSCHCAPLLFPLLLIYNSIHFLSFIPLLFYLQYTPNNRMPALFCSLIFFLHCHMAICHLWAHRFCFPSHLGNSCAGNLRTPISTYCSFPLLIHGLLCGGKIQTSFIPFKPHSVISTSADAVESHSIFIVMTYGSN